MVQQTKGKIFLADERGHNQTEQFRSYNTFNFGNYHQPHKKPVGDLQLLNDDTLAAGASLQLFVEADMIVLLIPVVGAIAYKDMAGNEAMVYAGEAQITALKKGTGFTVTNPYGTDLVNYLQVWLKAAIGIKGSYIVTFDLDEKRNSLIPLLSSYGNTNEAERNNFNILIGKVAGREELLYQLQDKRNGLFVYVIEGAFEVKDRLLHARDGLALWEINEADAEALSNDAILLLIELPV
jgi:quercetin 2,3-dioxygenase